MPSDPAAAPSAPTQRRLNPDDRRAQLVDAGLHLLKSTPLDGVSAPAVAAAAGVSKGLVFHYFPSQRELQAAVASAAADELLDMFSSIDPALDYVAQLRAGIESFISYIEQQPASYAAIARDAGSDDLLRHVFERTRDAIVVIVSNVVGLDQPTPVMRLYLRGWIAMVEETTLQWVLHRALTQAELVDYLQSSAFDLVARAVRARPES
ncbi:MAG: TetR family transcriptional regulator [Microthrixaceae bacterium]